jgi:serine protease Do
MISRCRFLLLLAVATAGSTSAASLSDQFNERLKSVVAVEFFIQDEIERHPVSVLGTVVDATGTIVLPAAAILPGVAPSQLNDFKVYQPGSTEPTKASYLGQDALTGWHFLRVEEKLWSQLVPITHYAAIPTDPALSEELWGIGLRNKDEDFMPYFLSARVALVTKLPQKTAVTGSDVAGPGLPVFNFAGQLAGLAQTSFGQNYLLFSRKQNGSPIVLVNVEESSVVLLADEVLPCLGRIPQTVTGRPIAWLGAYGMQPMAPEVAKLLQLENQSGVVLSDLMEGSPAVQAGLKERDIVLALDGQPLPRLKPDRVVAGYLGQEILRHRPGETITLTILRDGTRQEKKVTLGDEPKLVREADRQYFERLGFTVREFLRTDGIMHRVKPAEPSGVIVQFVKPGSPAATAGLQPDDWMREIDGVEIKTYAQALEKLHGMDAGNKRPEFVLLVSRGAETAVLRVKLN